MIKERTITPITAEQVESLLRKSGIQPTSQRIAIGRYVLSEGNHITAEDVKRWADENFPKISLATVYNTLGTLVNAGLIREFRFAHVDKVIYDRRTDDHFHFLDTATGELYDVDLNDVEIQLKSNHSCRIRSLEILFKGELLADTLEP